MALDMNAAVKIQASVDGIASINGLEKSLNRVDKEVTGLSGAFQRLGNAGKTVGGVLASIGIGALANTFATAGIDAERTNKRIANLAGPLKETTSLMKFATQAAKTYGIGQTQAKNAVTDLYARLRPTGTSLEKIKTAFIGVNNAAAAMNLTTGQTDNVMLQLSQALGSGKLQGDEFRSVMEQLPSIGQAVADVLGTDVAGLKEMSSQGKITSDVLLKALAKLSQQKPPPPDAYKKFQAALADLQTEIGTKLLPALTPLVQFASQLLSSFSALPAPLQTLIVAIGSLAAAFVILAPAINAIIGIFTVLGGLFAGGGVFATIAGSLGAIMPALAGLSGVFATISGWLGATIPVIAAIGSALSGLGTILVGIFTGPVGWAALLIAAGVAIYAFRDQVGAAINAIVELYKQFFTMIYDNFIKPYMDAHAALTQYIVDNFIIPTQTALTEFATAAYESFNTTFIEPVKALFTTVTAFINENFITPVKDAISQFATAAYEFLNVNFIEPTKAVFTAVTTFISEKFVKPVQDTINGMIKNIATAFESVQDAITRPFEAAMQTVRGIVNSILNGIGSAISSVVNAINNVIQGANQALANLGLPQISFLPQPNIPQFAKGGVVNGPTLAMVGEGGEREYIIPESKMAAASANYMSGARGGAVIPAFANGGVVGPSRASGRGGGKAINAQVSIQTGPVMQMGGTNYVTMQDLGRAVQTGVRQTLNIIQGDMNMRNQMGLS